MSTIIHIISSIPFLIFVVFATALGAFIYWLRADNFRYAMFAYRRRWAFGSDFRGKLAELSNQADDDKEDEYGLVAAERTLCSDFEAIIAGSKGATVSQKQFERAREYLNITGQNDIHPPGFLAKLGLFILILAESVGTGYVLAPWLSTEITPSQANLAAGVLAVAVAIVLAILTHTAGSMLAQYVRYKRKAGGSEGEAKSISIADDQRQDAYYIDKSRTTWTVRPNPNRMRFANRVQDPGSIGIVVTAFAAALIIAIMAGIFVIRVEGVKQVTEKKIVSIEQNGISGGGENPFALANAPSLPPDVAQAQQESRKDVAKSLGSAYKDQGVAASFILALIYLVTQFTAFIIAYRSAFSGQGKDAYEFTRGETSYDAFKKKYLDDKIKRVDSLLAELRQKRHGKHRNGSLHSFSKYLELAAQKREETRQQEIETAANEIAPLITDEEKYKLQLELALKNYNFTIAEQEILHQHIQRITTLGKNTRKLAQQPQEPTTVLTESPSAQASSASRDKGSQSAQGLIAPERLEVMCKDILDQPDKESRLRKKEEVINALRMVGVDDPVAQLAPILSRLKAQRDEERKKQSAAQELDALLGDD